jgi:hypothetical protein
VRDCGRALELAVLPEEQAGRGQDPEASSAVFANKALRLRLHVKRGSAHCQLGDYAKALEDYR